MTTPGTVERPPEAPASTAPSEREPGGWASRFAQSQGLVIALIGIGLLIYFWTSSPHFATSDNAGTLSQTIAPIVLIAVAEVLVLIMGEIDLSVGEVYVLTPFIVAYMADDGIGVIAGMIIALLVAAGIGVINGVITVKLRIPSFITTLGSTFAIEGIILITSNGAQRNTSGGGLLPQLFGHWKYAEFVWAIVAVAVLHVVLRLTRFGLHCVATGGNEVAASEAGIRTDAVKIWTFVICSFLGGVMGLLAGYRIGSLDPSTNGLNVMFYGVAAAVIGGTALTGGRGTMIGACIGGIVLGVLNNGFNIVGISAYKFDLILGLAILGAMILNVQLERLRLGHTFNRGSLRRLLLRGSGSPPTDGTGPPAAAGVSS